MTVLVVDDEAHARSGLRTLLARQDGVKVVGEAVDGRDAVSQIRRLKPDLVLLDVEMPEQNGLEVIQAVGPDAMPMVIIVTAYDQYAVAAFEASAIDYLLKPFSDERFEVAMARARESFDHMDMAAMAKRLRRLLGTVGSEPPGLARFTVKSGNELSVHEVSEIDWVEADQYYVKLHIGTAVHLVRHTMNAIEEMLPADRFVRIHRSTIVNIDRVAALEPLVQGDSTLVLKDGTRLRMSRRRRERLSGLLTHLS
jgi:two-component system, LytTR family, response regulator